MPTLPAINPERSTSGITVDPRTLERVVPESRRPDGSVRKELKIRPGFTPQEDVSRFRGRRQAMAEAIALPKGHIIGWTPPTQSPSSSKPKTPSVSSNSNTPLTKAALKNAKRKAKRLENKVQGAAEAPENWEDEDEGSAATGSVSPSEPKTPTPPKEGESKGADAGEPKGDIGELSNKLGNLNVS